MAEGQKIWFVYLSDHHEGPFTVAEIGQKAAQGLVNNKSLVWKDGMAEWVAAETIPEVAAALSSPAPAASAPAPAAPAAAPSAVDSGGGLSLDLGSAAPVETASTGGNEPSLAQLLAQSQGGGGASGAAAELVAAEPAAASLSLDSGPEPAVQAAATATAAPTASLSVATAPSAATGEPGENEQVWTMRSGTTVTGLYTMQALKEMVQSGQIPGDAYFWHAGITDFLPLASFPALQATRKEKTGKTAAVNRPRGLAPITAAADVGQEPDTDPKIHTLTGPKKPGFLEKFKGFFTRKKKTVGAAATAAAVASAPAAKTKTATTLVTKKAAPKKKISFSFLKPVLITLGILLVLAGAGAGYFLFLANPIPDMEDVSATDLEEMRATVKISDKQGGKLKLVRAVGDDVTPTFYVATNLPEGTAVQLELDGVPGTLVNAIQMKKNYNSTVDKRHLAVFAALADEGKPLPMGDYRFSVSANGAEPVKEVLFVGLPKKNHIYERRMSQYKEKLQGSYDKEMQELKEYITTSRSLFNELVAKITRNMTLGTSAQQRSALMIEWNKFNNSLQGMTDQMQNKIKDLQAQPQFAERIYQEQPKQISALLSGIMQVAQEEGRRLEVGNASASQTAGNVKAELERLEKWLAEAVMKSPLDALTERAKQPSPAAVPAPAPTTAPAPTPAAGTP